MVLCGSEERVCPVSIHEEIAASIPGATLVVVPGAGHLSTIDQPELVTHAMRRWLTDSERDLTEPDETEEKTA
jgi:pimeloyl-ACP methyl ester carboxylesterase